MTHTEADIDQALAFIRAGKIPTDEVLAAVGDLLEAGGASTEWVLDFEKIPALGITGELTADTMTIGEQHAVTLETGVNWDGINPLSDVRVARSVLRHVAENRLGDAAVVDNLLVGFVTDAFSQRERRRPADPS